MEEQFEHGEKVEVRNNDTDNWQERVYVGTMPNCKGHWCMGYLQNEKSFDGVPYRWKQVRKIQKDATVKQRLERFEANLRAAHERYMQGMEEIRQQMKQYDND